MWAFMSGAAAASARHIFKIKNCLISVPATHWMPQIYTCLYTHYTEVCVASGPILTLVRDAEARVLRSSERWKQLELPSADKGKMKTPHLIILCIYVEFERPCGCGLVCFSASPWPVVCEGLLSWSSELAVQSATPYFTFVRYHMVSSYHPSYKNICAVCPGLIYSCFVVSGTR